MLKLDNQYKYINPQPVQMKFNSNGSNDLKNIDSETDKNFQNYLIPLESGLNRSLSEQERIIYDESKKMETELVKLMVSQMKKSVHKSGFISGGKAEEMFNDMLIEEQSKSMTENYNFGIADSIYSQITGRFYR